jgi:hypothetical protein
MLAWVRRLLPAALKRRLRAALRAALGPQPELQDMVARNDALLALLDQKIIRTDEAVRKLEARLAALEAERARERHG